MRSKFGIQRPLPWGNLPIRKDERFSCQSEWNRSNETWSFILETIFGDSATSFHKENVGNAFEVQSFDRPLYYIRYMFIYLRRLLFDGRLQYTLFTIPTHSTSTNERFKRRVSGWKKLISNYSWFRPLPGVFEIQFKKLFSNKFKFTYTFFRCLSSWSFQGSEFFIF